MRDIIVSKIKQQVFKNRTKLGETKLTNNGEYSNMVEAVIAYNYDKALYWGTYEGVQRGLPTTIFEKNKPPVDLANGWGLKEVSKQVEVIL